MSALKIALIGCGAIGRVQALALRTLPEYELTALCNRHLDKAQQLAAELQLDLPLYTDPATLLRNEQCDVLTICLPPEQHHDAVLQALHAGCHVMVEKPMALSVAQCQNMVQAAVQSRKYLGVICQNRWNARSRNLKAWVDSRQGGAITAGQLRSLWWRDGNYYDLAWRGTWEREGGGCLMSHAVHQLDLLLWVLGLPQAVTAQMRNIAHDNSECEDYVSADFDYGRFNVSFICSLVHHQEEQGLILDCQQASFDGIDVHCLRGMPNGYPQLNPEAAMEFRAWLQRLPPARWSLVRRMVSIRSYSTRLMPVWAARSHARSPRCSQILRARIR